MGEEVPDGAPPADQEGDVLLWVEPALDAPSGGLRYNQRIRESLRRGGVASRVLSLRGGWPRPSRHEAEAAVAQVRGQAAERDVRAVILDGLVGGCVPELVDLPARADAGTEIAAQESGSAPLSAGPPAVSVLLVHLSLVRAEEMEQLAVQQRPGPGGSASPARSECGGVPRSAGSSTAEHQAVQCADVVVTTSHWSAEDLRRRYGRKDVVVAQPGAEVPADRPAPEGRMPEQVGARVPSGAPDDPQTSDGPLQLACVASLNPLKNHRLLAEVLEPLQDLQWELVLAGAGAETEYGRQILTELSRRLPGRVRHLGVLGPEQLSDLWAGTDLLLLPSHVETYGMVVTEACAHGVPAFVSAGTGAQEALGGAATGSGLALPAEAPQEWSRAIREFLTSAEGRTALAERTALRRQTLPTWEQAAGLISAAAGLRVRARRASAEG